MEKKLQASYQQNSQTSQDIRTLPQQNFNINQDPNNSFPIHGDSVTGNLHHLLRNNILNSQYFKDLYLLKSYNEIIDELLKKCPHVEPWNPGIQGVPSIAFCCLYKFILMKLTVGQIKQLIDYQGFPNLRCIGFLYIRFTCHPESLWDWFSKYINSEEEIRPTADPKKVTTLGDYLENLLTDMNYYQTKLPRIPNKTHEFIKVYIIMTRERKLRKRKNLQNFDKFQPNTNVLAISKQDNEWHFAEIIKIELKTQLRVFFYNFDQYIEEKLEVKDQKDDHDDQALNLLENLQKQYLSANTKQNFEGVNAKEIPYVGGEEIVQIDDIKLLNEEEVAELEEKFADIEAEIEFKENKAKGKTEEGETSKKKRKSSSRSRSKSKHKHRHRHHESKHKHSSRHDKHDRHDRHDKYDNKKKRSRSISKSRSKSKSRQERKISNEKKNQQQSSEPQKKRSVILTQQEYFNKLFEEVKKRGCEAVAANCKSEYAKRPQGYKNSLGTPLPQGSARTLSRSPSPIKKTEVFIEIEKQKQKKFEKKETKKQEISKERLKFLMEIKTKYGDASANQELERQKPKL